MNNNQLRNFIGTLLVFGQGFILCYIFFLLKDTFFMSEALELAALITPLFSVFLVAITKNFLNTRNTVGRKVGYPFIFISLFYPVVFLIALFLAIFLYQNKTIEAFAGLKKVIGVVETSFGIYLGLVIEKIFPQPAAGENSAG